ncbi:hypothetical protein [Xanthomarina sp.]|uniref:hypothetical protein n=1 Tax=Xanthomarina sp. TaxID=1931211 RepID=UPI002C3D9897|nr:hypothetical protein [Xanthomarina sp.]HLV37921.1 hypothetical protein [Xanthomarina sp.]
MIFTFIGVLILNAIIVSKVQRILALSKGGIISISAIVLIFLVSILVSRLVSFSKTTVTLNKKEMQVNRSFLFGLPIKSNFLLPYSQINTYVFQDDQNWYWLKIKDSKGKAYRIWKFGWFKKKEFKAFKDQLTYEINWFNQEMAHFDQTDQQKGQIKVAKNIYQGKIGLILGVISFIIIIVLSILLLVFGVPKLSFLGPGLIGLSGATFTLFKVWNERKNKDTVANNVSYEKH